VKVGAAGVIVGNVYDKYGSKNPVARLLMDGFLRAVTELYGSVAPDSVLEVGCGEGHLAQHLLRHGPRPRRFEACDLELGQLSPDLDPLIRFREASIYDLPYADGELELVVCCEVLEHLDQLERSLAELARVARSRVLLSTPREPIWRALNVLRGKYLGDFGNTPGHVQHFSSRALLELAASQLEVIERRQPIPWTVLLGRVRS
jgi:ubiquinone/menaquinone biosynthesis C-methylase UbiE